MITNRDEKKQRVSVTTVRSCMALEDKHMFLAGCLCEYVRICFGADTPRSIGLVACAVNE